jgi:hypothetical protein
VYSLCRVQQAEPNNNLEAESFRSIARRARCQVALSSRSLQSCRVLITYTLSSEPQELTIEPKRYGAEKRKTNMRCPSCHLIIDSRAAWKSSTNRFYCSEFCADSEVSAPVQRCAQKEVPDRLERLRRLLPLFEELKSNRITPRSAGVVQ